MLILLALIAGFFNALIAVYSKDITKEGPSLWLVLPYIGTSVVAIALFTVLPFRHVLESVTDSEFKTYFQILGIKLGTKKYLKLREQQPGIEQGADRYFSVIIVLSDHSSFLVERYPNLDHAEARLGEIKRLFA